MINLEDKKYWIWLSLIPNLGSKKIQLLLQKFKSPEQIYKSNKKELKEIKEIGEKLVINILDKKIKIELEKYIKYMDTNKIDLISIEDTEYPQILKQIYDPPLMLYIKGNKNILNQKSIAIVGCRENTEYGKDAAQYFAYNLSKNNINIVSGLAKGIDSYAHLGALSAKGKTIAILGNGLDTVYPKENIHLANKIIETGGAIISEYPPRSKIDKMNFPARNRIISGISNGIIVVEAKRKSGTLITVDFALEQGKDVFVVPGNINSINSTGTNELIKQGGKMINTYLDVLEEIQQKRV